MDQRLLTSSPTARECGPFRRPCHWRFPAGASCFLDASCTGAFVPKGHLRIARRFNAGSGRVEGQVPKGRPNRRLVSSRPFGTGFFCGLIPALKRRAILRCPSGTECRGRTCTRTDSRPGSAIEGMQNSDHKFMGPSLRTGVCGIRSPEWRARLQPQSGCVTQPRVGPKGQPWVPAVQGPSTPTGLWPEGIAADWFPCRRAATPLGLTSIAARLPRVGAAPTLGFAPQPRWQRFLRGR